MRLSLLSLVAAIGLLAMPRSVAAQTEIDRMLVKVNGSVLMQSDVTQARALKLVSDTSSDAATQRALENRLLMLGEITRLSTAAVPADDVAARRQRWQAAVGPDADALLAKYGMTRAALDQWFHDDARVENYLKETFGDQNDPAKARSTAAWVDRLRSRAGLR